MKILSVNKKINLNYQIIDSYEAGLSLRGTEVKSIMLGNFSIEESFAHIDKKNEIYIFNMYIAPFFCDCNKEKYISTRKRKLLLHKKEIMKINIILKKNRMVLIPTKIYFKNGVIKIEIALCKSKKKFDHREEIKIRDMNKEKKRFIN